MPLFRKCLRASLLYFILPSPSSTLMDPKLAEFVKKLFIVLVDTKRFSRGTRRYVCLFCELFLWLEEK